MNTVIRILGILSGSLLFILIGVPAYALPANLSLGWGRRPGLQPLTLDQAAQELQDERITGWQLIESARALVADRMEYSRRNTYDPPGRAFERGYGYCIQQAYALAGLLNRLGFEAKVVHAFRNQLPEGGVDGHAWVRVNYNGQTRQLDTIHYDPQNGQLTHTPLTEIQEVSPLAGVFFSWGCTAANAHRYYISGKDY